MNEFLDEAPAVFRHIWTLFCELRGINDTHTREQHLTKSKTSEVFFQFLSMIRQSNCTTLNHWAIIQNISNFAQGVDKTADSAFPFFGQTTSNTTCTRLFNTMTGNDKDGRAKKSTLWEKQHALFWTCAALIFTYDNYQRGVTLQEQHGKHSSAFSFKETH